MIIKWRCATQHWSADKNLDKNPSQGTTGNRLTNILAQASKLYVKNMCWFAGARLQLIIMNILNTYLLVPRETVCFPEMPPINKCFVKCQKTKNLEQNINFRGARRNKSHLTSGFHRDVHRVTCGRGNDGFIFPSHVPGKNKMIASYHELRGKHHDLRTATRARKLDFDTWYITKTVSYVPLTQLLV